MKCIIFLFLFFLSCNSLSESRNSIISQLKSDIEELNADILTQNKINKNKNSSIVMKAYEKHNEKILKLKKYNIGAMNKSKISNELRDIHRSSIELRDSLVLNSKNMNYSCIKSEFVLPKTNISIVKGDNWDNELIEMLNDSQLDSLLDGWIIHNLEWQFVVLELVNNK